MGCGVSRLSVASAPLGSERLGPAIAVVVFCTDTRADHEYSRTRARSLGLPPNHKRPDAVGRPGGPLTSLRLGHRAFTDARAITSRSQPQTRRTPCRMGATHADDNMAMFPELPTTVPAPAGLAQPDDRLRVMSSRYLGPPCESALGVVRLRWVGDSANGLDSACAHAACSQPTLCAPHAGSGGYGSQSECGTDGGAFSPSPTTHSPAPRSERGSSEALEGRLTVLPSLRVIGRPQRSTGGVQKYGRERRAGDPIRRRASHGSWNLVG